jgi:signal transduction histidine kinase
MATARTNSLLKRLTIMNMLVSVVALLLACAGFFAYDQVTFRQDLVRTLSAQAQLMASTSVSAIVFDDPQTAAAILSALQNSRNISSAAIFEIDRKPLAQYSRDTVDELASVPPFPPNHVEEHRFHGRHLTLVRQIVSEGRAIGFVYLRADLRELDQRLRRYGLIAFSVLAISLLAAILVSSRFRKSVAHPIVELAETAQRVSRDKDYSLRMAPTQEKNEIAVLVDSFNEMLKELQKSHNDLEQRVAERTRELLAANRELEVFSYSVSHDLRGPLDSLNGFCYLLLKQYGTRLDDQARDLIGHIRSSGRRMTELIDDLLNLSRVTTSTMHAERVDLSAMARTIMEELCRTAPARKVGFVASAREGVYGDPHLLRIVMENLLRNAWKYTSHHEQARIEFGQADEGGRIVYFVKDDGSGFDPRSAGRLFKPFQRLHSINEFPGNGIGLATVRRVIQRHGGEVWAKGAVEEGACFYFTLASSRINRLAMRAPASSGIRERA